MAIKLIENYAKRLGLPGYSSHQFSVLHPLQSRLPPAIKRQGRKSNFLGVCRTLNNLKMRQSKDDGHAICQRR